MLDLTVFRLKNDLGLTDYGRSILCGIASVGSIVGGIFLLRLRRKLGVGV